MIYFIKEKLEKKMIKKNQQKNNIINMILLKTMCE